MRSVSMMAAAAFLLVGGSARPPSGPAWTTPAPTVAVKPPTVTFEDAIQRATSHNPTFEVAYAELRRAQALVEQARASWLPTLNANATYTRLDAARQIGTTVAAGQDNFNANLTLTVPIIAPRGWVQTAR
jgi:outer membrane protein TolC